MQMNAAGFLKIGSVHFLQYYETGALMPVCLCLAFHPPDTGITRYGCCIFRRSARKGEGD